MLCVKHRTLHTCNFFFSNDNDKIDDVMILYAVMSHEIHMAEQLRRIFRIEIHMPPKQLMRMLF